jgi:hypothetical protein
MSDLQVTGYVGTPSFLLTSFYLLCYNMQKKMVKRGVMPLFPESVMD